MSNQFDDSALAAPGEQKTCPVCGAPQPSNANKCLACGEIFPFVEEPKKKSYLAEILVVVAIIVVMLALLLPPGTSSFPDSGRRERCRNNLKLIALALHRYHEQHGALPPAYTVDDRGNRLHSWRTLILPFLDEQVLYDSIDLTKPWNHPANRNALESVPLVYQCPTHASSLKKPAVERHKYTTYLASVGTNSCFQLTEGRTFAEITDGLEQTLMIIEVPSDQAVPWMSPDDADEALILGIGEKSQPAHVGGIYIALCDGAVRWLPITSTPQTRQALITVAGREPPPDF